MRSRLTGGKIKASWEATSGNPADTDPAKSLECFLQHLVGETVKETQRRGSRKLTASHLYVCSYLPLPSSFIVPRSQDAR